MGQLHQIIRDGDNDALEAFISKPHSIYDFTEKDENGNTPLHIACLYGNTFAAKILIDQIAFGLQIKNDNGSTPLHYACNGSHEVVKMLLPRLEYKYIVATCEWGYTPLHDVREEDGDGAGTITRLLMTRLERADLVRRTDNGSTPLHLAMDRWENAKPLIEVLDREELILKNNFGETPLHRSEVGDVRAFELLMPRLREQDWSIREDENKTPLQLALSHYCNHDVASLILAYLNEEVALKELEEIGLEPYDEKKDGNGFVKCQKLIRRYIDRPTQTKKELRKEFGLDRIDAAKTLSLVVGLCDGYFDLETQVVRFFKIMVQLPLELQMLVCNRAFDSDRDIIRVDDFNMGIVAMF